MSNLNYDEILKTYNNDPTLVLKQYKYENGDFIYARLDSLKNANVSELNDILNTIILWKINRTVHVSDDTLTELYQVRTIDTPTDILNGQHKESVKTLLIKLLKSKGVRLAMASTFLHFFNPAVFPIFDQRAYRVIYLQDYQASTNQVDNADLYLDYIEKCVNYYRTNLSGSGISFSDIDKYLYQLDIEAGNKVKNYGNTH